MNLDGAPIDLATLDREVAACAARLDRARARLAAGETEIADPFEGLRRVAGQTTYRALDALDPGPVDGPLRDALRRWVYELLQARVAIDLAADEAAALRREDPRAPRRAASEGAAPGSAEARTFAAALHAALHVEHAPRAAEALERAADLAAPVAAVRREQRARRFEAARRLGLSHPYALASAATPASLEASARALLDATEPLAKDVLARARRDAEGPWHAASAIHLALAKDAPEGWPAHLGARWLREAFAALAPRAIDVAHLPEPLGAASFLRAASAFGAALRASLAPRSFPFALARDPYPALDLRFGAALAAAVANPVFQRRVLGVSARPAASQARALRVTLLLAARTTAARFVLASAESPDAGLFEELTARVFGAPMPRGFAGAWPEPNAGLEPARLVATLGAAAFVRDLVDRFDEDWFANPRAGAHLAQIGCAPAWIPAAPPEDAPVATARAFEEALG